MVLVLVQIVTGLTLTFVYQSDPSKAYASMQAIQASGVWSLVRAMHDYTSGAAILLGLLFLIVALFEGTYKPPNHARWVAAVFGLMLIMMFQLTGHTLPWDQQAVRTTVVETGIAADAPVIGERQAAFLRAGKEVGPQTLSFWYKAHIWFLPAALLILSGLPLGLAKGRLGRGSPAFALLVVVALIGVSAALGAPTLHPAATPDDFLSVEQAPEWYTLPLHALLRIFQGISPSLTFVGTMVVPGVVVLFLLLLPWLDKKGGARWVKTLGAVGVLCFGALTVVGFRFSTEKRDVPVTEIKADPALVASGKKLAEEHGCYGCHTITGQGGTVGPKLDGVGDRRTSIGWHIAHMKDPGAMVQGSTMPKYDDLNPNDLKAIGNYLVSLKKE